MLKHLYSLQLGPTFIDQSLELAQGASVWKASGQFKSHTNLTPGLLVGGCCEKVNGLSSAVFEDTKVQSVQSNLSPPQPVSPNASVFCYHTFNIHLAFMEHLLRDRDPPLRNSGSNILSSCLRPHEGHLSQIVHVWVCVGNSAFCLSSFCSTARSLWGVSGAPSMLCL